MPNTKTFIKSEIFPLGDRVLIEESKKEEKRASGIILPNGVDSDKATHEGKVVAVGEGKMVKGEFVKPSVKKGDKVLFEWGTQVKSGDKEYFIVNSDNILAIIKN